MENNWGQGRLLALELTVDLGTQADRGPCPGQPTRPTGQAGWGKALGKDVQIPGPKEESPLRPFGGGPGQWPDAALGCRKSFSGICSVPPVSTVLQWLFLPFLPVLLSTKSFIETSPGQANPLSFLALGVHHLGARVSCRGPQATPPLCEPRLPLERPLWSYEQLGLLKARPHSGENKRICVSPLLPLRGGAVRSHEGLCVLRQLAGYCLRGTAPARHSARRGPPTCEVEDGDRTVQRGHSSLV